MCRESVVHFVLDTCINKFFTGNSLKGVILEMLFFSFVKTCFYPGPFLWLKIVTCCIFILVILCHKFEYNPTMFESFEESWHELAHFSFSCSTQVYFADYYWLIAVIISLILFVCHLLWQLDDENRQSVKLFFACLVLFHLLWFSFFDDYFFAILLW